MKRIFPLVAALCLLAGLNLGAVSDARAATAAATPELAEQGGSAPPVAVAGPVTEYRLPADKLQRATDLYRSRVALYLLQTMYGLVLLVAVLASRLAGRLRDLAERRSSRRFVQALIFAPSLLLLLDVLSLPLEIGSQWLQRHYGLSVQGWGSWSWDWVKGELLGIVLGSLVIAGLYALLRRFPRRWWLLAWAAAIPLLLLLTLLWPMFVQPLFNHFEPLATRQPQLIQPLRQVMARGGIEIATDRMFEMRASEKVTTYNAYVTGIGASKRVVVWDNTARDMSVPQTMFVFAHEQGHYALNHVWIALGVALAGLLLGLYAAYRLLGATLLRHGARWNIRGLDDWASLPLLLLSLTVFSLVSQPLQVAFSRHLEHAADVYGLEAIHGLVPDSPEVAAQAFQMLGEKALSYPSPNPLFVFFTYDHPPLAERIAFAAAYRPWEQNQQRYIR